MELDNAIKQQNFRDHMNEMYSGLDTLNKMPTASHYNEQFGNIIFMIKNN